MKACRHCGRIMGDKAVRRHEKVCEKNPNPDSVDLPEEATSQEVTDNNELVQEVLGQEEEQEEDLTQEGEPASQPTSPPSFPAAMCPDTLILHENRQMFFQVAGRRIEGKIYIEEVKMLR